MHKNNLGIMDSCSWAEPTVDAEVEPVTAAESPIRAEGTFFLDTSVAEGTYHSPNHNCLKRSEGWCLPCPAFETGCRQQSSKSAPRF